MHDEFVENFAISNTLLTSAEKKSTRKPRDTARYSFAVVHVQNQMIKNVATHE